MATHREELFVKATILEMLNHQAVFLVVFADILIVLGCAIVTLALGLLFLWLFIWFVGAVIGGLIRWVVQLGSQWCYKEVAA